ncbi:MAG: 2TM domain-containing protein [Acidimicrobiales bacterium]
MERQQEVDTVVEDPAWIRAKQRARSQREFYGHLSVYVLVSALLVVIDVAGGSGASTFLGLDWAFWPIGGWGIAVLLHAVRVFGPSSNWEERKAAQLYQQERDR